MRLYDSFGPTAGGLIVLILFAVFAASGCVGTAAYYPDKADCAAFGRETNREVKFVKFTPITWDCLTPTKDGRWISTSRLRDID